MAQIVAATSMSDKPFELFNFDGILGLGLQSLAVTRDYSFFDVLTRSNALPLPQFGVFLTESHGDSEDSEIAIGGHNPERMRDPLAWVPLHQPELGYWMTKIVAIKVDGTPLKVCEDGSCKGILDTGTSHLGVPSHASDTLEEQLMVGAGEATDCRRVRAPSLLFELEGGTSLELHPENYMRKLPLIEADVEGLQKNDTDATAATAEEKGSLAAATNGTGMPERKYCTARILPVTWSEPLGPNIFILGEPMLHRYYTVFDWGGLRVGFARSNHDKDSPIHDDVQDGVRDEV